MTLPRILVMGAKGNMGSRYIAILKHLRIPYDEYDVGEFNLMKVKVKKADGVIIATPTHLHTMHIEHVSSINPDIPILCEKPISMDKPIFDRFIKLAKAESFKLTMVNQYAYLVPKGRIAGNFTEYDYFNSGKDGRLWDCINIIGLDKTDNISIKRNSPIWTCTINGHEIKREEIDTSYIMMIEDWIANPSPNLDYIEKTHQRVMALKTRLSSAFKLVPHPNGLPENAGKT